MTTYIALLKGINVGGNRRLPMADLKAALTEAGFDDVRTVLASGNVVLEAPTTDPATLETPAGDRDGRCASGSRPTSWSATPTSGRR